MKTQDFEQTFGEALKKGDFDKLIPNEDKEKFEIYVTTTAIYNRPYIVLRYLLEDEMEIPMYLWVSYRIRIQDTDQDSFWLSWDRAEIYSPENTEAYLEPPYALEAEGFFEVERIGLSE